MDTRPTKKPRRLDTHPTEKSRRRSGRSNAPNPTLFVPNELIAIILSLLSLKNILQLKCVSKSWNALISDPNFIEKHLKKSSQNPHLTLFWNQHKKGSGFNMLSFPVHRLLKNLSNHAYSHNFHRLKKRCIVVGSCNGLLCLLFQSLTTTATISLNYWLRFWNPATRTRSKKLGFLCEIVPLGGPFHFKFTFGYDASTRTYKVVGIRAEKNEDEGSWKSLVKVFSLGNNRWRNIQSFNTVPINWYGCHYSDIRLNDGVHLRGTVNWLTNEFINHSGQFQIVSLDLSTETYKQFLLPSDFDYVPSFQQPDLRVLMDSLCFSHDSDKTGFVLWHMKEYGVQESWTQLLKISYQNLKMHNILDGYQLACIYVTGDMVILANTRNQAFIYNFKEKTIEKIKIRNSIQWFNHAKDYVESLVSVH